MAAITMAQALKARDEKFSLRDEFQVGTRVGRLVVTGQVGMNRRRLLVVSVACDCGRSKEVLATNLRAGHTRSCGCLTDEINATKGTHRHRAKNKSSPEYSSWRAMNSRCQNPNAPGYRHYGGRGIQVCKRWQESFESFLEDMGPIPAPGYTIDRKNNEGHYNKRNCRWATKTQQSRNSRWAILTMAKARKVREMAASGFTKRQVADLLGVNYHSVRQIVAGTQWKEVQ